MGKERLIINKKALTSSQIILIILAVAGFVIILWVVIANLNLSGSTQDEVCALSALSRATTPSAIKSFIPLKCMTKKVCINDGQGKCENYFTGEQNVVYVNIPKLTDNSDVSKLKAAAKIIDKVNVEELYRCWNMLGRGKLDIYPASVFDRYGWTEKTAVCTVCARVAIDNKVNFEVLRYVDFQEYERTTQVPGSSLTYLQTFTDKGIDTYPALKTEEYLKAYATAEKTATIQTIAGDTQTAFVFSQVKVTKPLDALKNLGKDALLFVGASFVSNPVGTVQIAGKIVFTAAGAKVAAVVVIAAATGTGVAAYFNQQAAVGWCGRMTSAKEGGQEGCTIIQSLPYSVVTVRGELNKVCPNVEGLP